MTYRSGAAADFNNVDVPIPSSAPLKLTPPRVLWDFNGDYADGRFTCPADGIYDFSACFFLTNLVNVDRTRLHIYQNGGLWATVFDQKVAAGVAVKGIQAFCPCDGLYANGDYFEIFVEITPLDPESECSGVLSGSREASFMDFRLALEVEASEIDSED